MLPSQLCWFCRRHFLAGKPPSPDSKSAIFVQEDHGIGRIGDRPSSRRGRRPGSCSTPRSPHWKLRFRAAKSMLELGEIVDWKLCSRATESRANKSDKITLINPEHFPAGLKAMEPRFFRPTLILWPWGEETCFGVNPGLKSDPEVLKDIWNHHWFLKKFRIKCLENYFLAIFVSFLQASRDLCWSWRSQPNHHRHVQLEPGPLYVVCSISLLTCLAFSVLSSSCTTGTGPSSHCLLEISSSSSRTTGTGPSSCCSLGIFAAF